ncbi:MAG: NAD(P)-binding protein, partial [Prochlorococcaceae cyanobacterium]
MGAGVAACSLVACLRQAGWEGSVALVESGRGPGGRAATRRSRHDPALLINHGAPLFNISASADQNALLAALNKGGWITPWGGAICSLNGEGHIGAPEPADRFCQGTLWQGRGGMEQLAAGLLAIAAAHRGVTALQTSSLVRHLQPEAQGWRLLGPDGAVLARSRWLVLSGTLLGQRRCQELLGWDAVPLQRAASLRADPMLDQAAAAIAATTATASSNLLLKLPAALTSSWLQQPWRLLQFSAAAQQRWGLRRVSLQPQSDGAVAVVAESSAAFAERHKEVYGSRSSAAQQLGAAPEPGAEAAVIQALNQALEEALGLETKGADRQLMRWGAAFPQPPGLPAALQLCPGSRIGFCGDYVETDGFGRIEGALLSAESLATQLHVE